MPKRPSELTDHERKAEAEQLRERLEEADRIDSWMFSFQMALDEMHE